jgi:hypothetical protein
MTWETVKEKREGIARGEASPQDSRSLRLPLSLKAKDSLESAGAIDIASTLTMSASSVLLDEVLMVEYSAFKTS